MKEKESLEKNLTRNVLENYRWFSKFSPVEKLKIAKRARDFLKILKNAK